MKWSLALDMHILKYSQTLPLNLSACWDFFSSPANLKVLTPEHLDFNITNLNDSKKMYPGQIITYTIRPILNIPIEWVTEITQAQQPDYFIDEQRFGPYKFWYHEHRFNAIANGVEMIDTIYYQLPCGILGKILNSIKIKHDIECIFSYRKAKLEKMFGPYVER